MKNIKIPLITLAISYVIMFLLSYFEIFGKWDSSLYYISTIAFFVLSYFLFEYINKKLKFNFAEGYIGLTFLIISYLGYFLAFYLYYSNVASLSGYSYSEFYKLAGLNMFTYLINSPYIYIALSFFAGWFAFYLVYKKK